MKALILNSGLGSRMGILTAEQPKCMTEIAANETILSRQLRSLAEVGIDEVIITTGPHTDVLVNYCQSLHLPIHIEFVSNPDYADTNYIYSIYCAREYLHDDILLIHGDLVFENQVLDLMLENSCSCMTVSSSLPLPQKDFKAVLHNNNIIAIGVDFFNDAVAAQPMYKLLRHDWEVWLAEIIRFCEIGQRNCYAENAFNEVSPNCCIKPLDIHDMLCCEIDDPADLAVVAAKYQENINRTVYVCFAADILHGGHFSLIRKARRLGRLIIGVLSDEAVMSYKRFPIVPFTERRAMFENIAGVYKVVEQKTLSYKENLAKYRPDYLVHGDDWKTGFQRSVRDEAAAVLAEYGGRLIEFPYSEESRYAQLESRVYTHIALPEFRRGRLKKALAAKKAITAIEAHSGITGLIAEKTIVLQAGEAYQFDAMWISSLCDSTAKGKPDIELVDMTSRFRTIDDIMEVTSKPIIFDGDTGGLMEHFVYTVRSLERMGVSMIIIEDKTGLKKNSLFGNEVAQTQDSIENFCAKIAAGKKSQKSADFMICARIESLILEQGMADALKRATAYVEAGADAIMIHSRQKEPDEIFEFADKFREHDMLTPLVVVPTSFNTVTEKEFKARGINIIIYANQLTRTGFPAMQKAAETILTYHRAKECDDMCMPIKDIITLIPEEI